MQVPRPHINNGPRAMTGLLLAPVAAIRASTSFVHQNLGNETMAAQTSSQRNIYSQNLAYRRPFSGHVSSCLPFSGIGPAISRASYSTKASAGKEPIIHDIFESRTGTWQYLVADPATLNAAIIDPVLEYDPTTGTVSTQTADALLSVVKDKGYTVELILETHAHADHVTAASYLQKCLARQQDHKPLVGIGKRIVQVQKLFGRRYRTPPDEYEAVFDKLFDDDETFQLGTLSAMAIHLPGHTPDHMGYKIGDNVFVGDSLFHADLGSARADFPGGSAEQLFNSGRKLLSLPDHVKIWVGHDYPPEGRNAPKSWMTVGRHREQNKHLKDGITEQEFIALREKRDATLAAPKLLHPSLQMNIRSGHLPKPTESGDRMLQVPLKMNHREW